MRRWPMPGRGSSGAGAAARLMVYFALALWLFRGRNCGYGQVMTSWPTGLSSAACRTCWPGSSWTRGAGLTRAGAAMEAAEHLLAVAGPREARPGAGPAPVRAGRGADGDEGHRGCSAAGCGSSPWTGRRRTCRTARSTTSTSDARQPDPGRGVRAGQVVVAAESGTGSLLGASMGPYRDSEQVLARDLWRRCFGPGMLVLADRKFLSWSLAREFLATGAHILWRASRPSPSSR